MRKHPQDGAGRQRSFAPGRPKILVVDDAEEVRGVLSRRLSQRGYHVQTAAAGTEALAMVRHDPPDAMLLDMEMPGLSGLDVLRTMRAEGLVVHVIGISGHAAAHRHLAPDSKLLGAVEFILKPLDLDTVEAKLAAVAPAAESS